MSNTLKNLEFNLVGIEKKNKSNQIKSGQISQRNTYNIRIGTYMCTCIVFVKLTHHVPRNRNRFGGRSLHIISGLR